MHHLTRAQLLIRQAAGPLPARSERHLASCRRCQAQAEALRAGGERVEEIKGRLGFHSYRFLGVLEATLTPDGIVLVRYRSPSSLLERSYAWERLVEISVGILRLRITAVHTGAGTLLYARLGSRPARRPGQDAEEFVPHSNLELTLVASDTPIRSSTTSPEGQAIFHLAPGFFALLLHQQEGWDLSIIWLLG